MCLGIEISAVTFVVVQANVVCGVHSRDVGGPIVCPVKVDVVTVRTWHVCVDLLPKVPLIREAMSRVQVTRQWLVDHLVAASGLTIERHQGIARPQ